MQEMQKQERTNKLLKAGKYYLVFVLFAFGIEWHATFGANFEQSCPGNLLRLSEIAQPFELPLDGPLRITSNIEFTEGRHLSYAVYDLEASLNISCRP